MSPNPENSARLRAILASSSGDQETALAQLARELTDRCETTVANARAVLEGLAQQTQEMNGVETRFEGFVELSKPSIRIVPTPLAQRAAAILSPTISVTRSTTRDREPNEPFNW